MHRRIAYLQRLTPILCLSVTVASACANILGLSDYEIDSALDPASGASAGEASAGTDASGGTDPGNEGGRPGGGLAGQAQGGTSGSASAGDASGGDASLAGTGSGGEANGGAPNDPCTTMELLHDKDFDLLDGSWEESSVTWTFTIFPFPDAHTPPNYAEFGDSDGAVDQEYGYMTQMVVIPQGTEKLTFSGVYQFFPGGTALDSEDDMAVYLYAGSTFNEVKLFNAWNGVDPAQSVWAPFSYEATRAELTSVLGQQARLEFETFSWATLFDFDTVSLKATVCPQN